MNPEDIQAKLNGFWDVHVAIIIKEKEATNLRMGDGGMGKVRQRRGEGEMM